MKYNLLFLLLIPIFLQAQTISLTFEVNMSQQIALGKFDPATEKVDVAGDFNGWGGTRQDLADEDGDKIYSRTITGFSEGQTLEFKFRYNGQWDGREEFPGSGNNRVHTIQDCGNDLSFWYNDERPDGGALDAAFQISESSIYTDGVVQFTDNSAGQIAEWNWTFEGASPATSTAENPKVRFQTPGIHTIKLNIKNASGDQIASKETCIEVKARDYEEVEWWNERVFYEIFVRSFYDSDGDGIGDFKGLTEKLDYLNDGDPNTTDDLGIGGIWLMPIHDAGSYHGYDVKDYRSIHPDFGTIDDFKEFLAAAHERGIKVIIDFVMNHSSSLHPWFQNSLTNGDKANWYRWRSNHPGYNGPWGQPVWHQRNGRFYYGVFWSGMPDLNYEEEEVKTNMFEEADFWLKEIGIDGFRLDAVKYMVEENTILEDTEGTFRLWEDFTAHIKGSKSDAFAVGEAWTSTSKILNYVENDRIDYCFEFDLAGSMLDAVNRGNVEGLAKQIQKIYNVYPHLQVGTFLTNHDQNRLMNELGGNSAKVKAAASIYLNLPGIPYLYYGEEIGMIGQKPDEFIRTPMQWTTGTHAGFSSSSPWIAPNNNFAQFNVATAASNPNSILNHYKKLISIRNREVALQKGNYTGLSSSANEVLAFSRRFGEEQIIALVNSSNRNITGLEVNMELAELADGNYAGMELYDNESGNLLIQNGKLEDQDIGPYEIRLFKITNPTSIVAPTPLAYRIFPNPSKDLIQIEINQELSQQYAFELLSLDGKRIQTGQLQIHAGKGKIDLQDIEPGMYLLRLLGSEVQITEKLIKW